MSIRHYNMVECRGNTVLYFYMRAALVITIISYTNDQDKCVSLISSTIMKFVNHGLDGADI